MKSEPSGQNITKDGFWEYIKKFIKSPVPRLLSAGLFIVGVTWQVAREVMVNPRDFVIEQLEKKLSLEDEMRKLGESLKALKNENNNFRRINSNLKNILEIPQIEKIERLESVKLLYQAPGGNEPLFISPTQPLQTGGKIWMEIQLSKPGGYFLAFLEVSSGKRLNLFPGTQHAILNGCYRIPEHLYSPRTQVQELAVKNSTKYQLSSNKIMIGPYILRGTEGDEIFHFYYMEKRNHVFESLMANAENIGKDVPLMKGIKHEVQGFDPEAVKEIIETPILYRNVLKLKVKKNRKQRDRREKQKIIVLKGDLR